MRDTDTAYGVQSDKQSENEGQTEQQITRSHA